MDSKSPATQVIDQYLIDLLGLQDEYELNWEDYFRSLREASIAARMSDTKYTSDQSKLITDELKRVKSEDKSTVFTTGVKKKKVNKTKVNASKVTSISTFVQKQRKSPAANIKPAQNLLPPSFEQKEPPQNLLPQSKKENISAPTEKRGERISLIKLLQSIDKTLGSILKTLQDGFKFDQKSSEEDRKGRERGRRSESEKRLEGGLGKGLKTIIGAASKALSPLQDIFDRIKNFIVWVLLGKAFNMFIKWFSDPANQKTFNTIVKFLSDHWLLLVGSYLAFGTSIGRLVTGLIGKLAGFTIKMGIVIAQKLLPLIGKMGGKGKLALLAAGGLAVAGAARALGGNKNTEVDTPSKEETAPIPKPETPSTSGYAKGGLIGSEKSSPSEKKVKEFGLPIPLELLLGGPAYLPFLAAKKGLENFDGIKEAGLSATKKASKFNPISLLANQFGAFGKDKNQKSSVPKFESGGVVGERNKKSFPLLEALKYTPLGLAFQSGKFGAENLGKAVSGGAGLVGKGLELGGKASKKALEFSPLGLLLKAGKFGAENLGKGLELGGKASKKALEFSPLGLAFKAGKFGAENLGKAVSSAAGLAGKAFSGFGKVASGAGDLVKSGIKNTVKLSTLPLTVGLSGLKGASDIVKGGILKNPKIQSELDKLSKQAKATGLNQDPKFIALGGIGGLASIIAEKSGPLISQQVKNQNSQTKTGGFASGGVIGTDLTNGIPITGAGKDNTLIKAKTGDAVLTEKDQSVLSKVISGGGIGAFGGPLGSMMGGGMGLLGNKNREDTTIAVRKGEAILTPEHQTSIFQKFGVNIPEWLSGRKPNKVDSDKIKTKTGVGFSNGGIVGGYASGGIVGGTSVLDLGKKMSGDPDHKFDPTLAQSIPLLYRMLQSGRFKEKGWGDKKFMDQLTARLLVESKNFSRAKEMYNSDPRDPKGKEGYHYFSGYSGMIGNKNADDAYNFRGRGAIQLTGRDNYQGFNKWLARNGHKGVDVIKNPDLLSKDPKVQALSTLYYLEDREKTFGVNFADMAKKGDSKSFTYNINGGYNHLAETQDNLRRIQGLSGGVNYGKGFAPAAPKPAAPAPRNPIMNIASRAMSSIGNFFAPPASAAPKPAAPKPAAPKPKRWAIDPRGWVGKQGGGIVKKQGGGIVKKQGGGLSSGKTKNIMEILRELYGMRSDSLERQGRTNDAYGLRASKLENSNKNFNDKILDFYNKFIFNRNKSFNANKPVAKNVPKNRGPFGADLGLKINPIKTNYNFKPSQNKNLVSTAFNPNVKLNVQQPKKQSISDSLRELREMRARSLDRQGDTLGALGVRASNYNLPKIDTSKLKVDPKKAYGSNLNLSTPTPSAPPPPSIDSATNLPIKTTTDAPPPPIQQKAGGGIIKKITSGIGGFFQQNRKRDIARKAIKKTTSKSSGIKSGVSTITGKKSPSENQKKGFWGNVSDTISGINSGVKTTKESLEKGKYLKSAANFFGGIPKRVSNIGSGIAKNPKMMKIGGAFGKFGGRMVPGLGVAASAADAAARAERGDKFGAALAGFGAASGATTLATSGASLTGVGAAIPAIAEAASMVSDVALLGKDIWDISTAKDPVNKKKDSDEKNKKQTSRLYKDTLTSKAARMQGGGLVNFGGGRVNIANPEKYYQNQLESMLGSQFGVNLSTPQSRPDSIQPFQQFGSGLGSLGERARNIFSPLTNLFGGRRNQAFPQPQSAPIAPTLPQMPQVVPSPPKSIQPSPSTLLAPVKKSLMQQQADELRAMRANSLERQGRSADAYGLKAFGSGKDFSSFFARGMIMENTGMNMPGGTADRQLTALQPGEYVVPKDTVDRVGKGFLDSIVGSTDSNSAASKIGVKPNNVGNKIKPYTSNGGGLPSMIKLPPITENLPTQSVPGGAVQGQQEVAFNSICTNKSAAIERKRIMDTLGFINHI